MSISIVIPTYNRAHLISRAIDSMLQQTFENWDLVIVDDGSTDSTETIVGGYKDRRIRYFKMNKNKGAAFCRNYGLKETTSQFVGFLDSDDVFHPDRLRKHWQLLIDGNYDCTVSRCQRHNFVNSKTTLIDNIEPKENLIVEFVNKTVAWKVYPIWKRKFLIDNNILFNEDLKNSQDYQFNCFAILNRPSVGYIHESLATKNEHDLNTDAYKIRKSSSLNSLKSHLISRYLVLQYAKKKQISPNELKQIKMYTRRHALSCYYLAFRLSFLTSLKLLVFSFTLRDILRRDL